MESVPNPERLIQLREEISLETEILVRALVCRAETGLEIGRVKKDCGFQQIRDVGREDDLLNYVDTLHDGTVLSHERVRRVVRVILDVTSETQAENTGLEIGDSTL